MIRNVLRLLRLGLLAAVLGCVVAPAAAGQRLGGRPHAPDADYERPPAGAPAEPGRQRGDPELGLLWIAVGVALLVFMVWVAVRIGDKDS